MGEEHRSKIRNSRILSALIEHVEGTREMTATQVSAGLGLLKKVFPDLSSVSVAAEVTHRRATELTDDELAAIAAGGGKSAPEAPLSSRLTH
jgi:cell division septal protein FtsQ